MQAVVVGAGFIGQLHRQAWEANDVEVVAVVDPFLSDTKKVALQRDGIYVATSIQEVWSLSPSIEIFSICTPPGNHYRDLQAIWQHSSAAVLMEKPVCANEQDYRAMLKLAANKKLMIGLTQRFYPEVQRAAEWVKAGRIGRVLSYHDTMILSGSGLPSWYSDLSVSGGGVLVTNGVHLLDRMQFILDQPLQKRGGASIVRGNQAYETTVELFGMFKDEMPYFLHLEWSEVFELQQTIIYGTEGRIELKTWEHATLHTSDGSMQKYEPYGEHESFEQRTLRGLTLEMQAFCEGMHTHFPIGLTLQEHLPTMEVIWHHYNRERSDRDEN